MYNVSDAYKVAVANSHRKSKVTGTLKIGNKTIPLDDNDIIKDSLYVTNQCTNGNEFEFGCVYAAECGITIKSAIDRYSLYDAELQLYWSLWTGSEWEAIPLGMFYISEANRINDKISIKALDGMTKLDKNVIEDTQGTMLQLVPYIAEKCGVELAQTKDDLISFANCDYILSVYEKDIETYRDLLAYICMICGCFATFDRSGKLKLVKHNVIPVKDYTELYKKQRFSNANFSDYTTSFIGVKARFIAEENYAPYEVVEEGTGLVLDMGDIPILRGLPETKKKVLQNVYNVVKCLSYTPFELETLGNPAIELGDLIVNKNVGKDSKTYASPVTYYYWTYRGKHKLRAVGGNPKLAGVTSKQEKQASSIENGIEAKSIVVKNYSNAEAITFIGSPVEIAHFNYAATESSKIIFLMTVRVSLSLDGLLVIKFYTDEAEDSERVFKKYLERGEHFVTISELYEAENNDRHTISIKAHMEYFESDSRLQEANVHTCRNFVEAVVSEPVTVIDNVVQFPKYNIAEVDTRTATATIPKGGVKAIMYGQGVAGEGKWDGTINFSQNIDVTLALKGELGFNTNNIHEDIIPVLQDPVGGSFSENLITVALKGGLSFGAMNAYVNVGEVIKDYVFNTEKADLYTYDKYITTNNNMFALKTIYNYESTEQEIDAGKMCSVALDYTGLTVESVVVENG